MYYIIASVLIFVVLILFLRKRAKSKNKGGLKSYSKNSKFKIKQAWDKQDGKKAKESKKSIFHHNFVGDIKASNRFSLSQFVTEVIYNKEKIEEVVISIESPGGSVAHYGHAMSELKRIREANINLIVCVDTIAASGGYLMACVANKILAAPYAMVGSIGVVSFIPNIRKLLENFNIKPRTFTAGEYKRTLTLTDEDGEEERKHYQDKLENIHYYFKKIVLDYRPQIEEQKVCTGDYWLAQESVDKNLNLVDEIMTSSSYLFNKNKNFSIVTLDKKESFQSKIKKIFSSQLLKLVSDFDRP